MHYCEHNVIPVEFQEFHKQLPLSENDSNDAEEQPQQPVAGRAQKRRPRSKKNKAKKGKTKENERVAGEDEIEVHNPLSIKDPLRMRLTPRNRAQNARASR